MSLFTLRYSMSLSSVRDEILYTKVRLRANPLTAKKAAEYDALLKDLAAVQAIEQALTDGKLETGALIDGIDDVLDPLVDRLSNMLLSRTGQNRDSELYKRYFGTARPSDVKRPVLGKELELVQGWLPSLKSSTDPELKALGLELESAVTAGVKAEAAYQDAERKLADFRRLGERKTIIDRANRIRQGTHGELAQLPHSPQGSSLPRDFASSFFRHRERAEATVERLQSQVAEAELALATLREELKAAEAAAATEASAAAAKERLALEAQLRAAEVELAAASERTQSLRNRIGAPAPAPQ